jgi:hypothetical protein
MLQLHSSITPQKITELCELAMTTLENPGLCIGCGADHDGIEPDAEENPCDTCGSYQVYGAEQLALLTL